MVSERRLCIHYSLLQFLYWTLFAAYYAFGAAYLYSLGLSSSLTGLTFACAGILSAVIQPLVAGVADRSARFTTKSLAVLLTAPACACLFGAWLCPKDAAVAVVLYAAGWTLLIALQFLINAFGMEYAAAGSALNFGVCRAFGSLGYAVFSYLLGLATARWGTGVTLPFGAVCCLLLLTALALWPPAPRALPVSAAMTATQKGGLFARYPRFAVFVAGSLLSMVAYCMCTSFLVRIVENLGGGSTQLGTAIFITALCEIPTIFLSTRLRKRFGSGRLMRFTAVMLALKLILVALSGSMGFLYAAMAMQLFSYSLFVPVSVFYADGRMGPGDKARGQAVMTLVQTLGNAGGALLGGVLLDAFGVSGMLLFLCVCSVVGAAGMLLGVENVA